MAEAMMAQPGIPYLRAFILSDLPRGRARASGPEKDIILLER
jgi:hypothetical protein